MGSPGTASRWRSVAGEDNDHVGKRAEEIGSEEKRLRTGRLKCRIPIVIS